MQQATQSESQTRTSPESGLKAKKKMRMRNTESTEIGDKHR